MTTRPVPLLTRRSKTAPRFTIDDPLSLWDYFADYERLAEAAQLDEKTKIKKSVIYLTRDDADFWESLDEYSADDWQAFKNAILSFYPGSIPTDRWTLVGLAALCDEQKTKRIQTRGDFAEFNRTFSTVSKSLIKNDLLSELEAKKIFWSTLDQDFKDRLIRKIELTKPAYTSRMILTISEIRSAASLVLDGTLAETSSIASKDAKTSTPVPALEPGKAKSFDMERFAQQMLTMMAQTIETAVSTVFHRVSSMNAPPTQTNNHFEAPYLACVSPVIPAYPRNAPLMQKDNNVYNRFSNIATVASSTVNASQTSSNLVKIKNVSPVETHVESKRDLNAHIAALQWRISRQEDGDDDEGLEEIIQVLKTRVKKKTTDGTPYQGPQEKRVSPTFAVPSISVRAVVPSKAAPEAASAPVPPILKILEHPYRVPNPRKVVDEPADAFELGQSVALSVEELLTLFPDVRKYFQDDTTTRQVVDLKKDLAPVSTVAVYLAEEASVVYSEGAHTTSSKPKEELVDESLTGRGVVAETRNLKNRGEELSCRKELSHCRIVPESFEERYCSLSFPLLFSHAIDPPRDEVSLVYSNSTHVQSLKISSSMYSLAPPVPMCRSITANPHRIVSIVDASPWIPEMKMSLQEIAPWPPDSRNEGSAQFEIAWITLPAWVHRETQFNKGSPVHFQIRDIAPQLKFTNPHVSIIEFPVLSVVVLPIDDSPIVNASLQSPETQECRERALEKSAPLPCDARSKESMQFRMRRIVIPARQYPDKLPYDERLIYARGPRWRLHPKSKNRSVLLVELLVFAAPPIVYEAPMYSSAVCTRDEETTYRRKLVPILLFELNDLKSEGSAQFETSRIGVFVCTHLFSNPHTPIVEILTFIAATLPLDEPFIASISQRSLETTKLRQPVLKEIALLSYDLKNGGLFQFGTFWIGEPACTYLGTPTNEESSIPVKHRCSMLLLELTNPQVSLVEIQVVVAATLPINGPFVAKLTNADQESSETKKSRPQVLMKIACLPYDYNDKGLVQLGMFLIAIPARIDNPHFLFIFETPLLNTAALFRNRKIVDQEKSAPANRLEGIRVSHYYSFIHSDYPPMRYSYHLSVSLTSLQARQPRIRPRYDVECEECAQVWNIGIKPERNGKKKLRYLGSVLNGCDSEGRSLQVIRNEQRSQQYSCPNVSLHTVHEGSRVVHRYPLIRSVYPSTLAFYHALVRQPVITRRKEKLRRQGKQKLDSAFVEDLVLTEATYRVPTVEALLTTTEPIAMCSLCLTFPLKLENPPVSPEEDSIAVAVTDERSTSIAVVEYKAASWEKNVLTFTRNNCVAYRHDFICSIRPSTLAAKLEDPRFSLVELTVLPATSFIEGSSTPVAALVKQKKIVNWRKAVPAISSETRVDPPFNFQSSVDIIRTSFRHLDDSRLDQQDIMKIISMRERSRTLKRCLVILEPSLLSGRQRAEFGL